MVDSYLTLSRVSEGSPVLQFSIFASLAFKLPLVIFFFLLLLDCLLIECQLFLFACCRTFIFFFFPFVSLLCYLYPSMVVFTALPFDASVSSGLKKSFTSSSHLFLSLPTACPDFGTKSWVPIQQLSLPIVLLVAMLFSSPTAISFFCAFRSNTESWHPSFNLFV